MESLGTARWLIQLVYDCLPLRSRGPGSGVTNPVTEVVGYRDGRVTLMPYLALQGSYEDKLGVV